MTKKDCKEYGYKRIIKDWIVVYIKKSLLQANNK